MGGHPINATKALPEKDMISDETLRLENSDARGNPSPYITCGVMRHPHKGTQTVRECQPSAAVRAKRRQVIRERSHRQAKYGPVLDHLLRRREHLVGIR